MPPSFHPQAKFDPIPPDLDLDGLVDRTPNFKWVQRVTRSQIRNLGQREFEKVVLMHVLLGGKPLVIGRWNDVLPNWLFNVNWLEKTYDKKEENVRDIGTGSDIPMTTGHYLRSMKTLANQWTPTNFRDERRQRLYLKDIDCPAEWHDSLRKIIHPALFYLNENVAGNDPSLNNIFRSEAETAPVGDLMSSLPQEMRAQNLMCYIGHEGTYTPAHREMCASLGQNIMVEASDGSGPNEKPGSSIWFMTESKDREVVREYFMSILGHDIEVEKHFAQINAWKKAPFDVYIVDQRPGDFILIPPLAAHQVWNRGTRTMKVAWNRTTAETLDMALHEALPKAQLVCRDEQYKNKAIIYYTLSKYHKKLQVLEENAEQAQVNFMGLGQDIVKSSPRAKQLADDFKKLLGLFTEIIMDEMFAYKVDKVEFLEYDSCVTCSYCRSNIFNRFLTCKNCVRPLINGEEDAYDICMDCYAMGRSCACLSKLQWCEQWSWSKLVANYESWRAMVIKNDGFVDFESSPQPLEVARQRAAKKSLAQICQEALKRRPWKDITKPEREKTPSDSEPGVDDERPKKKHKRKQKKGELRRCHVCCHKDYTYRLHECSNPGCSEAYCYGVLYRAFGMMPRKVLEDEQWQCPKCQGICNCGACRRVGNTIPYMPKNTLLGHDTRLIADDRSVEALVDFRLHNLSWLKAAGDDSRSKDSKRMQRLREQANDAKAQDATHNEEAQMAIRAHGDPNSLRDAHANGASAQSYGDQSHVLGSQEEPPTADYPPNGFGHFRTAVMNGDNDLSMTMDAPFEEEQNNSLYPDPPMAVRQRVGMGYYEQDDTPDKILFDPYQAPNPDAMRLDEPEISEFVKKTIRAAKRRARRENEDPEFVVGKYARRHRPPRGPAPQPDTQPDPLDSMDPALFDEELPTPDGAASHPVAEPDPAQQEGQHAQHVTDAEAKSRRPRAQSGRTMPQYDPNEPILRHAKPRIPYAEREEDEIEEVEVGQPTKRRRSNGEKAPDSMDIDTGTGQESQTDQGPRTGGILEQRQPETEPQELARTRSGRPTRSAVNYEDGSDGRDTSPGYGEKPMSRRRGRSRKIGVSTVLGASAGQKADEDSSSDEGSNARRPRGRPPRSQAATSRTGSAKEDAVLPSRGMQLLSMSERMALKGKKFKMGKRKSPGADERGSLYAKRQVDNYYSKYPVRDIKAFSAGTRIDSKGQDEECRWLTTQVW
ncbi:LOW QUALITY PROTEIN: Zinc-finger domain of monoamine-oxidase A repressor R1 [Geosmithia morbida]|uniref:Zinc-finger domain of monoamine-oxidase A repressor R1 n=1 Tax=Geosmithia morbida TaxID=1094350 RepID=A0A9P5D4D7_9HYPO|nr:LOW QUALITY PROTEIN: Zinc-finger domain of monoamine-oxidase A repressor R1 [Geosmithia morbida]KAF4125942.1 LOW QUALITY PROTEIN: Zinc-finger domain of monoamine-oxidase A repressor R1 [Geosmithia morbida]